MIAVFQDLEQRQTGVVVKRLQTEVIKDDEVIVIGNEKYIIFGKMEYIRISNNDASFSVTMVHRFR